MDNENNYSLLATKPENLKLDWWQRLHNYVGERFIGSIENISRATGNRYRYDFWHPRKWLHLEQLESHEIITRVGENNDRRSITTDVAIVMTAVSFVFVNLAFFGVAPALKWTGKQYTALKFGAIKKTRDFASSATIPSRADDECESELTQRCYMGLVNADEKRLTEAVEAATAKLHQANRQNVFDAAMVYANSSKEDLNALQTLNNTLTQAGLTTSEVTDVLIATEKAQEKQLKRSVLKRKLDAFNEATALVEQSKTQALTPQQKARYETLKTIVDKK